MYSNVDRSLLILYAQSRRSLLQNCARKTKIVMTSSRCLELTLREKADPHFDQVQRIFLAIPTISTITFLPALLTSRLFQARILCLLSMSSLICTAYILISIPKNKLDAANRKHTQQILQPASGPIRRYINYFNGGLSILILLNSFNLKGKRGVHEGFWLLCILPAGE